MQTVIIVIHLIVVVAMVGVVLLQRSEGGGLGIGGGGGFLTNRGSANLLTRTTAILAGVFFVSSLVLSMLAGMERRPQSILRDTAAPAGQPGQPGQPGPALPGQGGQSGGGLLDALRQGSQGGPPASAPPGGAPQVPQSQ
jgi:preprotein translocase subunit SecG